MDSAEAARRWWRDHMARKLAQMERERQRQLLFDRLRDRERRARRR